MSKGYKALLCIFMIIAFCSLLVILTWAGYGVRLFQERFKPYDSADLIKRLESKFYLQFPDNMNEIHAAKTIRSDDAEFFILTFICDPNSADHFMCSLLREDTRVLEQAGNATCLELMDDLDVNTRQRGRLNLWSVPKWFTNPIKKGKYVVVGLKGLVFNVWLDTSDSQHYKIFIRGSL